MRIQETRIFFGNFKDLKQEIDKLFEQDHLITTAVVDQYPWAREHSRSYLLVCHKEVPDDCANSVPSNVEMENYMRNYGED